MSADTAIQKTVEKLQRTTSRNFPVAPIALVTGPTIQLSAGDVDQPFYVASIDKVFIATLLAQLFDEGYCQPNTPIGQLLPAEDLLPLPAAPGVDNARDVTVQHLLSHTSGLPDVMLPPRGYSTTCSIENLRTNPHRVWSVAEFLQQASHLPPIGQPGERFRYSDTGYFLLIRIIEEARGGNITEQLRTRVFELTGMVETARWANAEADQLRDLAPDLAPFWLGRPGDSEHRALAPNLNWSNGLGGPSTANELVQFQRALHEGQLCDAAWVRFFSAPRNRFRPGIHYGSGMVALRFGGFLPLLRGYPEPVGGLGYTATHMFYYPDQQTHVILNYHAYRRMQSSFQMHIRIAGLINRYG